MVRLGPRVGGALLVLLPGRRADGADVAPWCPSPPSVPGLARHAPSLCGVGVEARLAAPGAALPCASGVRRAACAPLRARPTTPAPNPPPSQLLSFSHRPLLAPQEWKRSRHPQLFYESKLYKIMAGAGELERRKGEERETGETRSRTLS